MAQSISRRSCKATAAEAFRVVDRFCSEFCGGAHLWNWWNGSHCRLKADEDFTEPLVSSLHRGE
jgi:hypothetical protein